MSTMSDRDTTIETGLDPTVWVCLSYRDAQDEDYGSRGFTARDPEGNLWSFGTYRGAPKG
jgi:hypothetical protein